MCYLLVKVKDVNNYFATGDVGGQLGFWIGISVVTLCEFIQFFVKMILTIDWKGFRRQDQS